MGLRKSKLSLWFANIHVKYLKSFEVKTMKNLVHGLPCSQGTCLVYRHVCDSYFKSPECNKKKLIYKSSLVIWVEKLPVVILKLKQVNLKTGVLKEKCKTYKYNNIYMTSYIWHKRFNKCIKAFLHGDLWIQFLFSDMHYNHIQVPGI